jgi:hypothetical protein
MVGVAGITALHALGREELEISPSLDTESSSLDNSSRMACNNGDPLWVTSPTMVLESAPCWWQTQVDGTVGDELAVSKVCGRRLGRA